MGLIVLIICPVSPSHSGKDQLFSVLLVVRRLNYEIGAVTDVCHCRVWCEMLSQMR